MNIFHSKFQKKHGSFWKKILKFVKNILKLELKVIFADFVGKHIYLISTIEDFSNEKNQKKWPFLQNSAVIGSPDYSMKIYGIISDRICENLIDHYKINILSIFKLKHLIPLISTVMIIRPERSDTLHTCVPVRLRRVA